MLTNNMKSPNDVKDNLGHDIKTNDAAVAKCQLLILEPYSHEHIHGQGQHKLCVKKADYRLL